MGTEYRAGPFELKAVDLAQRTIEGHAAVFSTIDRVNDIIDAKAFDRTLGEKKAADVGVFIGHDMSKLPIGVPLEIRPDAKGLYTKTLIFKTSAGDDLLATAHALLEHGQTLGQSIGYHTVDKRYEQREGKTVRRLLDVELGEYSYAASQAVAHPDALVTAVKAVLDANARDALDDGDFAYVDAAGGRHLPINDATHVRAALGGDGFGKQTFASLSAKRKAWRKILAAAKREGVDVAETTMPKALPFLLERKAVSYEQVAREVADLALKTLNAADVDATSDEEQGRNYCYPVATFADSVVIHYSDMDGDDDDGEYYYQVPYVVDHNGHVSGIGAPVLTEQTWTTVKIVDERRETKAGTVMSKSHLDQLHGAMDALHALHATQHPDKGCKYNAGMGDHDDGTDEGVGDSKTVTAEAGSLEWFEREFAGLTPAVAGG